jgi:hypothetical protein
MDEADHGQAILDKRKCHVKKYQKKREKREKVLLKI